MSDEEHDVHFEAADAGASTTFPQQAGTIRKNGFIVIKNRPCKVCDLDYEQLTQVSDPLGKIITFNMNILKAWRMSRKTWSRFDLRSRCRR